MQGVERIESDSRKQGNYPNPEYPHRPPDVGGGMVAQQQAGDSYDQGQRVGQRSPYDEQPAS